MNSFTHFLIIIVIVKLYPLYSPGNSKKHKFIHFHLYKCLTTTNVNTNPIKFVVVNTNRYIHI